MLRGMQGSGNMNEMQQQMMNNPELMNQLMSSPHVQNAMQVRNFPGSLLAEKTSMENYNFMFRVYWTIQNYYNK